MKKTILLLAILLLNINTDIKAQRLEDYAKTQKDIILTYDDNWTPTGSFSIKNLSNKYIEDVEIVVYYEDGGDRIGSLTPRSVYRAKTHIAPNERKLLSFRMLDHNNKKPKSFSLSRIRYADGTICDE